MRIDRAVLDGDPVPRRPRTRRGWRDRLFAGSTLALLMLVTLLLLIRLPDPAPSATALPEPQAPPLPAPSPTPAPTPTMTSPQLGDTLETLYVDIAPDDFAQIVAKREEALRVGLLLASDADFVPATLRFRGENLPASLRLKGDWIDHYAYAKWSYRVELQDDHYLLGMRRFALQDIPRRAYLNEWLYLQNLQLENVLTVDYHFVRVVLNGQEMGSYVVEEVFAKELLESQQRREGPILRYEEDLVWDYRAAYENDLIVPRGVEYLHLIDAFQTSKIAASPDLTAQWETAAGRLRALERGEAAASEVFDVDAMAKFLALSDVWGAQHALIWHNLRFYYNPVTTRLEPVVFDAHPLEARDYIELLHLDGLRLVEAYGDPRLQQAYLHYLAEFSQPEYLARVKAAYGAEFDALHAALEPEFGADVLAPPWDVLALRQRWLRELLSPAQMVYSYVVHPFTETLTVEVGNLLDFPVEILGLAVGENWFPAQSSWVAPDDADLVIAPAGGETEPLILKALPLGAPFMDYLRLQLPPETWAASGGELTTPPEIRLTTRVWGLTRTFTQTALPAYPPPLSSGPLPAFPTVAESLAQHPALRRAAEPGMLTLPPGAWEIAGDLVLPAGYGLRLSPGTTLRFGADNFLLTTGPLDFEGTEAAPIVLEPVDGTWRGVIALEAGEVSRWRYVTVTGTDALRRDGWILTGGLTFYRSPLRLEHCRIVGTQAEDGLNVIQTHFELLDSEFANTASDAFDADFSTGFIERCSFHDIGADGIDVSGSEVYVRDTRMVQLGDKGISVGEQSRVTAENLSLESLEFGVVSKDLSQVFLFTVTLKDVRLAGLAAYVKKPVYGPATLTAENVTFVDVPPERRTLVQTGCWIDVDGERVWGTDVDVAALYR